MALDVYFQQDVRRNIVAVAVAMLSAAAAHGVTNVEYCRGVLDTSRAQALNHGMPWSEILKELRGALVDGGRGELLDALAQVIPSAV
ncbi:MAG: hypothetical protein ISS56_17830 [Anaerolineae bacterium]|nr:hypothetical protein [Anaerolineae bacterium]